MKPYDLVSGYQNFGVIFCPATKVGDGDNVFLSNVFASYHTAPRSDPADHILKLHHLENLSFVFK
jgi:hypothetical protein